MYTRLTLYFWLAINILDLTAQDSISIEALRPLSYTFSIEDGLLVGAGADFLKREIDLAQFTLLGDYPNSKNIAELITALAPELQRSNYTLFATGVGVGSAEYLNKLPGDNDEVISAVQALNDQYRFKEGEVWRVPIPEMKCHEDVLYLSAMRSHGLEFVGFSYESYDGLLMLLDQLWECIPKVDQLKEEASYHRCKKLLVESYNQRNGDLKIFANTLERSEEIQSFLEMASHYNYNKKVVDAFKNGLAVARMYGERTFYQKNRRRVYDEKRRLAERLDSHDFNLKTDRLFIKWDINYLSRGLSNYGFYEVGNMISELANFNGEESLHIGMLRRYYLEDGELRDDMLNNHPWISGQRSFIRMGQEDLWTIIDLRPLRREFYYYDTPEPKYSYTDMVEKRVRGYDLIIIPPTDWPGEINMSRE